ncbi:hypothetical protein [Sutterella sp.]|uniref:hypothetical protein n=1 Tax=Sutterella sp. TaxID=1981025 RepID=UPI0025F2D90B|nr:hypothetical protein [uncultured Sutterella sp.]
MTGETFSERRSYLEAVLWDAHAVFTRLDAYAKTLGDDAPVLAFRSFHPKAGTLFFRSPQTTADEAPDGVPVDAPQTPSPAESHT